MVHWFSFAGDTPRYVNETLTSHEAHARQALREALKAQED